MKLESLTDYSLLDGTGLRTRSGSSPITFSMDSSDDEKTFNLGTLAENENFTLEFTLEASELPLNDHMIVSVEIEFDDSEGTCRLRCCRFLIFFVCLLTIL